MMILGMYTIYLRRYGRRRYETSPSEEGTVIGNASLMGCKEKYLTDNAMCDPDTHSTKRDSSPHND